jgi:acetate kinase
MFCYILAKYIGALAVTLPRIDALIFTGGIGENGPIEREKVLSHLKILGFDVNAERNNQHGKQVGGIITQDNSVKAVVIKTNEELMIAKEAIGL